MGGVFVRFIIFAQDRIRLGTKLKQVWFSAFDFFYLCKNHNKKIPIRHLTQNNTHEIQPHQKIQYGNMPRSSVIQFVCL